MKSFSKSVLTGLLIFCFFPNFGYSCTTFRIDHDNKLYFGRHYDWLIEDALLVVNKRGVKKTAYLFSSYEEASSAVWTSKYGSVTFNQYGVGFPQGGINETGLTYRVNY